MPDILMTKGGVKARFPDDRRAAAAAQGWAMADGTPEPTGVESVVDKVKGAASAVANVVTGDDRKTAESESLPDFQMMPEMRTATISRAVPALGGVIGPSVASVESVARNFDLDAPGFGLPTAARDYGANLKTALGTTLASPEEQVRVVLANNPDVKARKDEKGNIVLRSKDGSDYVLPPGLRVQDVPQLAQAFAAFTPAGRVASIPRAILAAGGTQAAIEGAQSLGGGSFDGQDVALAGATNALGPLLGKASAGIKAARAAEPAAVDAVAAVGAAQVDDAAFGKLLRRASQNDVAAREELARLAVDAPEVVAANKAAFDTLGVPVPADIISDAPRMQQIAGLVRSKMGGQAKAVLDDKVTEVVEKADDILRQFDAVFVEGTVGKATVSARVLDSVKANQQVLKSQAKGLYDEVDAVVPKSTPARLDKTSEVLDAIAKEQGGVANLSATEKKLFELATSPDTTYGALTRFKTQVGDAMSGRGPFVDAETGALKRLYGALSEDHLANVERVAGPDVLKKLRGATAATLQQKRLEERMVSAYGRDLTGSIETLMTRAATGDVKAYAKLKATVPAEQWKETVATSLAAAFRKGDRFDLAGFASKYPALRENSAVYSDIMRTLGPESDKMLSALHRVSKRMTEARGAVQQTGKGNQVLEALEAPSDLVERVLSSAAGKGVAAAAGGAAGGGMGALGAHALVGALQSMRKPAIQAATELLNDPTFSQLIVDVATGKPTKEAIRKVALSDRWKAFAAAVKIPRDPSSAEAFFKASAQAARPQSGASQ